MNEARGFEGTGVSSADLDRWITTDPRERDEEHLEVCDCCDGAGHFRDPQCPDDEFIVDNPGCYIDCEACSGTGQIDTRCEPDWDSMPGGPDYEE